jgi:cytochrome b6-f complex iron-sulfur subunit
MAEHDAGRGKSRRGFLNVLLGASLAAWLASVLYPILRYLTPLPLTGPTGPARLTREELSKLEQNHFVIVPVSGKRVIVVETAAQELLAFDAVCTHETCTVSFLPEQASLWCACHDGRFDLTGRVVSGPPPRPLPVYNVQRLPDGAVIVSTEGA